MTKGWFKWEIKSKVKSNLFPEWSIKKVYKSEALSSHNLSSFNPNPFISTSTHPFLELSAPCLLLPIAALGPVNLQLLWLLHYQCILLVLRGFGCYFFCSQPLTFCQASLIWGPFNAPLLLAKLKSHKMSFPNFQVRAEFKSHCWLKVLPAACSLLLVLPVACTPSCSHFRSALSPSPLNPGWLMKFSDKSYPCCPINIISICLGSRLHKDCWLGCSFFSKIKGIPSCTLPGYIQFRF